VVAQSVHSMHQHAARCIKKSPTLYRSKMAQAVGQSLAWMVVRM
jgi:hypothetical protein